MLNAMIRSFGHIRHHFIMEVLCGPSVLVNVTKTLSWTCGIITHTATYQDSQSLSLLVLQRKDRDIFFRQCLTDINFGVVPFTFK